MKQDGPYDTRTLTQVFAWSSIALLAATVWMVIEDHDREWKDTQEAFREIEIAKRHADLNAAIRERNSQLQIELKDGRLIEGRFQDKGDRFVYDDGETRQEYPQESIARVTPLLAAREAAYQEAKASRIKAGENIEKVQKKYFEELGRYQKADLNYKNTKSEMESFVYEYEHAVQERSSQRDKKLEKLNRARQEVANLLSIRNKVEFYEDHDRRSSDPKLTAEEIKRIEESPRGVKGIFRGVEGDKLLIADVEPLPIAKESRAAIDALLETVPKGRPVTAVLNAKKEVEAVAAKVAGTVGLNEQLSALRSEYTRASKALEALQAEVIRLQGNLKKVDRNLVNDWFRNEPLADFIAPSLNVKQIVVEPLKDDYFFAQIRKVDRCETCHLSIDKKDFTGMLVEIQGEGMVTVLSAAPSEDGQSKLLTFHDGSTRKVPLTSIVGEPREIPSHFQSHPKLDVFLSSSSPHPKLEFGCTVCHQGEGRSMDFTFAAHTPTDGSEEDRWSEDHHWHKRHHWDFPQVRTQYLESSCLLCHDNNRPVESAPKLNFGREVWERASCYGCHKMKGFIEEPKRGPDLRAMKDKLTPEWVFTWLENPANFRPKTNMPRFWFASGEAAPDNANPEDHALQQKRDQAEILAVTKYLFALSGDYEPARAKDLAPGKVDTGKRLFEERGCLGCHKLEPEESLGDPRGYTPNEYGPNLANIGDKLGYAWLVAWLKDPQHYWEDTRMPNLQLTDSEARDIASYLAAQTSPEGPPKALPKADPEVVKSLVRNFLSKDMTEVQVDDAFEGRSGTHQSFPEVTAALKRSLNMSATEDQLLYLGRQMVTNYGCFGCHLVTGMESRPGIGAELSNIGDKDLHKVDWGHTTNKKEKRGQEDYLAHMVEDWLQYKVRDPRFTDKGRKKSLGYLDRARMPRFNLTEAERESLATFLSGHTERQVPEEYKYKPSVRKQKEIEGAYQIYRKNCKACHVFEPDTIVLERPKMPEDEADGDIPVNGKSIDEWGDILSDEDSGEANRIKAADALSDQKANAIGRLRETLSELEVTPENQQLRAALTRGIKKVNAFLGTERVTVKGLVMLDSRFQTDASGAPLRDASGQPKPFPLNDEDGEPILGGENEPAPAWGQAIVQLWEDGAGKEAGAFLAVADHPWADPTVYFNKIVSVTPRAVGAEAQIPATLRNTYPSQFQPLPTRGAMSAGTAARRRGGAAFHGLLWPRVKEKLGRDPRVHSGDVDIGSVAGVADAVFGAQIYGPPHLRNEGAKVQTLWLRSFLRDPSAKIRPWLEMRMPNYGLDDKEAQSLADYFAALEEVQLIERASKRLKAIEAKANGHPNTWPRATIKDEVEAQLDPIHARDYFELTINDGALSFRTKPAVTITPVVEETADAFRARREGEHPYWYSKGYELFIKAECLSCHIWEGRKPGQEDPSSWGPDLSRVRNRIRPEWFEAWVLNPKAIVPGTKMSQQFGPGKYPEYFGADPVKQVEVVKDFVFGGMKPGLEAFPREIKNGGTVRVSSQLLSLDNYDKVYVRTPDGDVREYSLKAGNLRAEKSDGRTVAFALDIEGKPGTYLIATSTLDKDGKVPTGTGVGGVIIFHARAEVTVK